MTTVTKLGIQGIRSFDHAHLEVLEFERPCTLIVGPNGSGKTTIIECLKMAATGGLPPNSKNGHGFIHDPQVAHLPEVKAQIKMLFRTGLGPTRDKEICAIRSFQLSNKRDNKGRIKPQFKAIDSVLRTSTEDGNKASLSHRCADMDTQVPELMGVSKAILESVIFCHQEDSSWPLQDPITVKKRFDDIFGASRYTKALENIKALQREWTRVTKDRRSEAELSQAHLDQATKLRQQKDERIHASEEINGQLEVLDKAVNEAREGEEHLQVELASYESRGIRVAELRSVLQRIEGERDGCVRRMEQQGQDVYRESHEELQQQAQQFEKTVCESVHKVRQIKAQKEKGESDYHTAVESARRLREEMGETVAAAELLSSRRKELTERLRKVQEPSVAALRARLDGMAAELARLEREQRQRDTVAEERLAEADRACREAMLETSRNESRAEDAKVGIRRLEEEVKTLEQAVPQLDSLVRQMKENEAALSAEGSDARLRQLEKRQEEIGRRRHDLQYSITRKSSEVAQLEAQSDAHVEVDALRRRVREAEADVNSKAGEVRSRALTLLGQMPEATEAETKVVSELVQTEQQLKKQRATCQDVQKRISGIVARRGMAETELRRVQAEEGRLAQELGVPALTLGAAGTLGVASAGASDFQSRLASQREQVELSRKDLAMTESAQHMYEKFREKSRTKNACQFCRRGFCTAEDKAAFEDSVERLIVKIPSFLEESRRRLTQAQEDLARLEAQRPRWDRLEQLRQVEIPQKQKDVAACMEEEKASQTAAEPEERELLRLEDRAQQLQNLRADAAALQRGALAAQDLRSAVRAKEVRLLGGNSKVSLQAERDQLRVLQEQLCELGREEDAVRTQRDILAKQQEQLRTELAVQKSRLQVLQKDVARRGDIDSELANRQADLQKCEEVAKNARATADAAAAQASRIREDRKMSASNFRRDVDKKDAQVRELQREVDSLTEIEKDCEVMKGRVENAEMLKAKQVSADEAARAAERELEGLRARLEAEEEKQKKREKIRECLEANLRLKSLEGEIQRHESEIAKLLQELGGRDLEALKVEIDTMRRKVLDLARTKSFREGELANTKETVRGLEVELASPLYANVEQRHREAIIRHESAAYAAKDLGRYHQALDRALMKYHSMKMSEINRTIKELWQRIYRGRDIDYILIRSDTEEGADGQDSVQQDAGVGRALRSYNYRTCMVCGDAEMEMRGRCSAGQRVLASLIIRLALADSFCVNCGILALDEPTTNLDAANIKGLAEAISMLIEARRGVKHFQLIMITHDEAFVNHLCHLQVCDWFYQLNKDENGCSKITRQDIRLLG
mmetsp:Transcript_21623/g.40067  ORF Transcript_21623/g.40067 Transcript_21623/m.40067 type:complete len:1328 (-) Transcript_21623:167-4150(-)